MRYAALICGAFDVVVRDEGDTRAASDSDAQARAAASAVHDAYCAHVGPSPVPDFDGALAETRALVHAYRRMESKEVSIRERMRLLLRVLGRDADRVPAEILERLAHAYAGELHRSLVVPAETMAFLKRVAPRVRIAIVANADHSPALYDALDRFGIRSRFDGVVVSDAVGWRLPHRIVFERAFEQLGVEPSEALFVGDQLYPDIYGAVHSRLDAVWIRRGSQDWRRSGFPAPTWCVDSILDVLPLLEADVAVPRRTEALHGNAQRSR
jgi:FMN phosphatase YigB (HAD superfamily)